MIILALTLHGMKDEDSAPIYLMVDDFYQVSRTVNAQAQGLVLIAFPLQGAVIPVIPEGMQNILPAYAVFECGHGKLNEIFHHAHSTVKTAMGQHTQ
jgi:hypothetical protein